MPTRPASTEAGEEQHSITLEDEWGLVEVVARPGAWGPAEMGPWLVEGTFGWFGRYRRLSKDYEHNPASSEAWIYVAMIHRMSRFSLPDKNRDDDLLK